MNKIFKKICITALGVLCAAATINAAEKVKLNKTSLVLEEGSQASLKITGSKKPVKWSSSNKKAKSMQRKLEIVK